MLQSRKAYIKRHIEKIDGALSSKILGKHYKMQRSPFVFYRGSTQLFYADLANNILRLPKPFSEMPLVCVMGDCHTSNFGFLTEEGSHGDTVVFAPNDFDDACIGHAIWDLMRFLVSLALASDHCQGLRHGRYEADREIAGKVSITNHDTALAMSNFINAYVEICDQVYQDPAVIYQAIDYPPEGKLLKFYQKACRRSAIGEEFSTKSALAKAVETQQGQLRFQNRPDKYVRLDNSTYINLEQAFAPYMDDPIIDIVGRKNAGTGSANMARFYFLVGPHEPHDEASFARCHIVEVKQQRRAAPLLYYPDLCPVNRLNPAHLTARCQKKMQRRPDLLLDEVEWNNAHWLIRSRHHAKVGLDPEDIGLGKKAVDGGFSEFAGYCGKAIALAHCRSDRRSTSFEETASKVIRAHQSTLIDIALQHFNQVIEDYRLFCSITGKVD